jgi:hypothetical protein
VGGDGVEVWEEKGLGAAMCWMTRGGAIDGAAVVVCVGQGRQELKRMSDGELQQSDWATCFACFCTVIGR